MPTSEAQPMRQREGFPPGVPCWIDINQPDPAAAAAFYCGLFGWQFREAKSPKGRALPGRDAGWQTCGGDRLTTAELATGSGLEYLHRRRQRG